MRPQISEKILTKTARSLSNCLGPDAVTAEGSKEGPHLVGSNDSVFGS